MAESNRTLLKLHGSLNWARVKGPDKRIEPLSTEKYQREFARAYAVDADDQPPFFADISSHLTNQMKARGLDVDPLPMIVPPTWSKGEYQREIGNVWARATKELEGATTVSVLGYSLPPTDQFFRLLFGLGSAGDNLINKFIVVDPNLQVVQHS